MTNKKSTLETHLSGVYTALATPFTEENEIDFESLRRILDQQTRLGIRKFVVCGTTGESPTLSAHETESLFRFVAEYAETKRAEFELELVAGTGSNDTRRTIEATRAAEALGYRNFLVVVPYYNKPSQAGLYAHFQAVADAVSGNVILYNVPGRTGISFAVETIVALAAHPRIRAIKEASGKIDFLRELRQALSEAGRSLVLLSGDDETYSEFLAAGGHGVISVSSHVCPGAMLEITQARANGDVQAAQALQATYLPLFKDLFIESNPVPLKWMLEDLGLSKNRLRLPLVPAGEDSIAKLRATCALFDKRSGEYRR